MFKSWQKVQDVDLESKGEMGFWDDDLVNEEKHSIKDKEEQ